MVEEASHEGEIPIYSLQLDEFIRSFFTPLQEKVNIVSCFPFQDFDDDLFCDLESEEVLEESLEVLNPSCHDKGNVIIYNIYEFIHVGRCKWDLVGHDEDPIYDMEGHFQFSPLQLSYEIAIDSNIWRQGNDTVTNILQKPNYDLPQYSHDDLRSYLEDFDEYSFELLDLFYEEYYQHCARILIRVRTLLA